MRPRKITNSFEKTNFTKISHLGSSFMINRSFSWAGNSVAWCCNKNEKKSLNFNLSKRQFIWGLDDHFSIKKNWNDVKQLCFLNGVEICIKKSTIQSKGMIISNSYEAMWSTINLNEFGRNSCFPSSKYISIWSGKKSFRNRNRSEVVYRTDDSTCMLYTTLTMCMCVRLCVYCVKAGKQVSPGTIVLYILYITLLCFYVLLPCFIQIFVCVCVCECRCTRIWVVQVSE